MSEHARLAPSAGHRWVPCGASVDRTKDMDDVSGPEAERGTAAHQLLEYGLKGLMVIQDQIEPVMWWAEEQAPKDNDT